MKKIFKILKRERLTQPENAAMRQAILTFMSDRPLWAEATSPAPHLTLLNFLSRLTPQRPALAASLTVVLIVVLTAGTALAAESTLPGDLLYPVKIHFNEPTRAALTFDAEARVAWETRRVERRLEEMVALTAAKRLDEKTSEQIAAQFSTQTDRVEQRLQKLNEAGATDEAVQFAVRVDTSITAHRRVLERVAKEREERDMTKSETTERAGARTKLELGPVILQLQKRQSESPSEKQTRHLDTGDRASNETGQKNRLAAEARITERTLQQVKQTIEQIEADTGGQPLSEARAELDLAQTLFNKGQADQAAGELEAALATYTKAREHAKEAKILARWKPRLNFDLNEEPREANQPTKNSDAQILDKAHPQANKSEKNDRRGRRPANFPL